MAKLIPAWWGMAQPGSSYRPSNGTEGACFHEAWCFQCERDKDGDCDILARSFLRHDSPEYPVEWIHDERGVPSCRAFIALGDEVPRPRCTKTIDMFPEAP